MLRSSSTREPRDPPLEVVLTTNLCKGQQPWFLFLKKWEPRGVPADSRRSPPTSKGRSRTQGVSSASGGSTAVPAQEPERASPPTTGTDLPSRGGRPRAHARARTVMILPQVHLRKPCYDFYFIDPRQIKGLSRNGPRVAPRSRTGPTFSWTRTLCSSDGRCVQRAGT